MENTNYHNTLSNYFYSKSQEFTPLNWDKCSSRILSELPFQILQSSKPNDVNFTLSNPMFLDASIQNGLLNNLLDDLKTAVINKNLKNIIPVRNSILNAITAIRSRPSMSIFSILNRLLFEDVDEFIREYLKLTQQKLDKGIWLCTQTKLPENQQIYGIIDINIAKNHLYVLKENRFILIQNLETHNITRHHQLNTLSTTIEVSINPVSESIATLDKQGNLIIDSVLSKYKLKPQSNCFKWFYNGIIGINIYGFLVYIDLLKSIESVMCDMPILPNSFIKVTQDLKTAIVVSGDRPNYQKLYLVKIKVDCPFISEIELEDVIITSCTLDQSGTYLLFSTLARELVFYNVETREIQKVTYRMASNLPVRGKVDNCFLFQKQNKHIAILTTTDGELLIWDTSQDSLKRKGTFKGLKQYITVEALAVSPQKDKIILATNETVENLEIEGEETLVPKTPVNNCCLTQDGWLVTLNEQEKKLSWFYDNKHVSDFINNAIQPYSVVSFGGNGMVVVGCKNGTVIKLSPNITPIIDDAIDLFEGPIVSVINWGEKRILAVSKNAQIKITDFEANPHVKEKRHIDIIREEQIACRLGESEDIVLCGRSHAGDSLWSVYVIRSNDRREKVFESKEIVRSISSSEDGKFIYAVINGRINCYTKSSNKDWHLFSYRKVQAKLITCCINDYIAVVLEEKGLYWLELWDNTVDMKTITAVDLPFQATCISSLSNLIAIGTEDGKHVVFKIQP